MTYDLHFWISLASLSIIIIYAIMVFRNVDPLVATAVCVALGFLFNKSSPLEMGDVMEKALGSFLALVGFIIMLGRGLGEILNETRVSHTLVYKIVYGIGINTQRRVKVGVILSSLAIVGVLGTLAGGLAILAPILRPIASKVGITRPSLGVLLQAAGEEALILGPFAPPVVALLGVVNISYLHMLIYASVPIAFVTIGTSWIMSNKLQKKYKEELFEDKDDDELFKPSRLDNIVTTVFILVFLGCVTYGLIFKAKTSFVVFVMLLLAVVTGLTGKLPLKRIFELLLHGMSKNLHLFFIFLLLDPFLNLVQSAGGFDALTKLFMPLEHFGGKPMVAILTGLTGAFGMPAASAAVIKMLSEMFSPAVIQMQLPLITFAFSMLLATRITNFAYPGANMFAAMGFAESENIKAMIQNGLTVAAAQTVFLIVYCMLFS